MSTSSAAAARAFAAFVGGLLTAGASAASAQSLTPSEAKAISEDAYICGYSLITTEVTRVQMTAFGESPSTILRRSPGPGIFRHNIRRFCIVSPKIGV